MITCGVVLHDEAKQIKALTPYLKDGSIGTHIYCRSTHEQGPFLEVKVDPSQADGTVKCAMTISIPLNLIVLIVTPDDDSWIGFTSP